MALTKVKCWYCGKRTEKRVCDVIRARRAGLKLYCNRRCAGLAHRCGKTKAQRVAEKAAYDRIYRAKNLSQIKAKKAAYFQRTYDPVAAAVERKKHMARHVEYCRRPEYREWKSNYDKKHRATKQYGPFAEVAILTIDLNREIKGKMSNAEIKWKNQTANKTQYRDRQAKEQKRYDARPRRRERRDGHSAFIG